MTRLFTTLLISLCTSYAFASSPQLADYIIYKNDTIPTYNLIVEAYLQKRIQDQGRLYNLSFRNPQDVIGSGSFNCWRGYQAIYKMENDSLFVTAIIGCHSFRKGENPPVNYIDKVFGDKVINGKVHANWYTGTISFPTNKENNESIRWDGVFERVFRYEKVLKIEEGRIIEISDEENYVDLRTGRSRLQVDSINNVLFDQIKNFKWTKLNKFDCGERYTVVIGKDGKIAEVIMTDYQTKESINEFWDSKREYKHCIKSMKKALSSLQFDIIRRKGVAIEEIAFIEIWFNEDGTIENWSN